MVLFNSNRSTEFFLVIVVFFSSIMLLGSSNVKADNILEMIVPALSNPTLLESFSTDQTDLKATSRRVDGKIVSIVTDQNDTEILSCYITKDIITLNFPVTLEQTLIPFETPNSRLSSKSSSNKMCAFIASQILTQESSSRLDSYENHGQIGSSFDLPGCDNFPDIECTLTCCAKHDECYSKNNCDASSWNPITAAWDPDCYFCNPVAAICIILSCDNKIPTPGPSCYDNRCGKYYDCGSPNCDCNSPCSDCSFSFDSSQNGYTAICNETIQGYNLRIHYFESDTRYEIVIYQVIGTSVRFLSLMQRSKEFSNWAFSHNDTWIHPRFVGEEDIAFPLCGDGETGTRVGIYSQIAEDGSNNELFQQIALVCRNSNDYSVSIAEAYERAISILSSWVFLGLDQRVYPGSCQNWWRHYLDNGTVRGCRF